MTPLKLPIHALRNVLDNEKGIENSVDPNQSVQKLRNITVLTVPKCIDFS